jgi:hypothetical protein
MKFFRYFPKTIDESSRIIANLSKKLVLSANLTNAAAIYYSYRIKDGERLDVLSKQIYGNDQYHWVIAMINNMMDPRFDVPLKYDEFNQMLINKYGSVEIAMSQIHHYVDADGLIVDQYTTPHTPVYSYDYEESINESKRMIKLVRPEYISQFVEELKRVMGV